VPRALTPAFVRPVTSRAARPKRSPQLALKPAPSLPELVTRPAPAAARSRPAEARPSTGPQRGSTPDRIVLPVFRLARLPESIAPDRSYTVRSGDTLGRIARQHGVTPRSILVANGLLGASEVTPGRRLSIPGTITIAYNDEPVGFDVQPRVEKGMAITPFRQIFEHAGGVVRYEADAHLVSARNPEKEIQLKIGSREALVNSAVVLMDRAAFLDSGRTMVPVKFMTQALDLKAEYDLKTGAIYLIHK
jgi:LysM repeat protein